MTEMFFSTDVEADGPIPGPHSMLSIGSAAFMNGKLVDTFSANLELLENATPDPKTMDWWKTQPDAWDAHRIGTEHPQVAMTRFKNWIIKTSDKHNAKPVFVGYPAGFDFTFVYWYLMFFCKESPFSFSALDIKTFAAATLNIPYRNATKRNFPKHWFGKTKHNHVAVDDAVEQGELFMNILKHNQGKK